MKQFHIEVKEEVEPIDTLLYLKDVLGSLGGCVNLFDLCEPGLEVVLLSCTQSLLEVVADLFKFFTLMQVFPVLTKDIFDSAHIDAQSSLDLFGPEDLVGDGREAPYLVPHGGLVLFRGLVVKELVSEDLNVFLDLP